MQISRRAVTLLAGLAAAVLVAVVAAVALPGGAPPVPEVIEMADKEPAPEPVALEPLTSQQLAAAKSAVDTWPKTDPAETKQKVALRIAEFETSKAEAEAKAKAEAEAEAKAKAEAEAAAKAAAQKQAKADAETKHEAATKKKTYTNDKKGTKDGHEHDQSSGLPAVHSHVVSCTNVGSEDSPAADVRWDVKVKGGSGWSLVDGGSNLVENKQLDHGVLLRYQHDGVGAHPDYPYKARVTASFAVEVDGQVKSLSAEAWVPFDHC